MLNGTIDLHLHTSCSDGLDSPEKIVECALSKGLTTISITDHDTVDGIDRAVDIAKGTGLEVIPGIELSAMDGDDDLHILGYYINYKDLDFRRSISFFRDKRRERAIEIVKSLNYLGLEISIDAVLKIAHGAPIGRPHIAQALLSSNQITFYNEAFIRYIGFNGPAYVPKYPVPPGDAISLIRENGGIPVLAHPYAVRRDELIQDLVYQGLMGIEVIHPLHPPHVQEHYRKLAGCYGLIITGGSDWHGENRRHNLRNIEGTVCVPEDSVAQMKLVCRKLNPASDGEIRYGNL